MASDNQVKKLEAFGFDPGFARTLTGRQGDQLISFCLQQRAYLARQANHNVPAKTSQGDHRDRDSR